MLAAIILSDTSKFRHMTSLLQSLLVIISFIIVSCGQKKKEIRYERQNQLDTLNLFEAEKLSKNSNAIIGWDTAENFTYSLQETFESSSRPISFIGVIKDILKKDSTYFLKVVSSNPQSYKSFIAEISVNAIIFKELKSKLDTKEENEGCFIFQVTKISSHQPILKSEIESDGDNVENTSSYLTLDFDETLIKFQGKLVTYFLYNRVKEYND